MPTPPPDEKASPEAEGRVTRLTGITWDHPRGILPLEAAAAAFEKQTGITVEWTARPLHAFEDTPLSVLAPDFDLLAIDHPFIGDAVVAGVLAPLDGLLPSATVADRAADAAGPSHASYSWAGQQWALAVDAACMVSARRVDLCEDEARTWDDALELARRLGPKRVLLPANPTHVWGTFLSLCEAVSPRRGLRDAEGRPAWWSPAGIDRDTAGAAWELLSEVLAVCAPDSLETDPITALDRLGSADPVAYLPLVFGYVTYARADSGLARVRFSDAPGLDRAGAGTLTGGVGLAISSSSTRQEPAARFLAFATDRDTQAGLFARAGGQPGRRSAWTSGNANELTDGFFSRTLSTMDRAFLRPRVSGYPRFQMDAASRLHALASERASAARALDAIDALWESDVLAIR